MPAVHSGACPPDIKTAMEAEHCKLTGCDQQFTTLNYTGITTTPRKEWDIVVNRKKCPHEQMRFNRRIPFISDLLELPLARNAKLSEAEVIAIVLYTGPMVRNSAFQIPRAFNLRKICALNNPCILLYSCP